MAAKAQGLDRKLLASYLNDHLGGSLGGVELARRVLGSNRRNRYTDALAELVVELEEDREVLREVMSELGLGEDRLKKTAGWAGEKLGRLKLNGRLIGYSPLSRLIELEGLTLGVQGKLCAWQSLREVRERDERLAGFDFTGLADRARRQLRTLDRLRAHAAKEALRS